MYFCNKFGHAFRTKFLEAPLLRLRSLRVPLGRRGGDHVCINRSVGRRFDDKRDAEAEVHAAREAASRGQLNRYLRENKRRNKRSKLLPGVRQQGRKYLMRIERDGEKFHRTFDDESSRMLVLPVIPYCY